MKRVIGIDLSKMRLDVYSLEDGQRLAVGNDAAGIAELVDQLGVTARDLLVMKASGGYERTAQRHLSARGLQGAIVNAARVRAFARASGCLAKIDRVDAAVIARYGAFARPAPTPRANGRARCSPSSWPIAASSRPKSPRAASSSAISPLRPCACAPSGGRSRN
jgi:transposase